MRTEMKKRLKAFFRDLALKLEVFVVSGRSYEDIEGGHSACSARTVRLLPKECEDANKFLANLRFELEKTYFSAEVFA